LTGASIRIDKWLWHARFFKTRSIAQAFIGQGKVRVNSKPVSRPSQSVKPGDVLTFVRGLQLCIIEVAAISTRRGPATEAQTLYNDISPPRAKDDPDVPGPIAPRVRGTGRPTKRERRDTDRLRNT